MCASSIELEWLARLCTLFLFCDFSGKLQLFCDNAAVQLKGFSQRVHFPSWLDTFARLCFLSSHLFSFGRILAPCTA